MRLIAGMFLILQIGCKPNCVCTDLGCPCPELNIRMEAGVNPNLNGHFEFNELQHFVLYRSTSTYQVIDSMTMRFSEQIIDNESHYYFDLRPSTFSSAIAFKDVVYLIHNRQAGTTDTLENIHYEEEVKTWVCNDCSPCEDEKVTCVVYDNEGLTFNGIPQAGLDVLLLKK